MIHMPLKSLKPQVIDAWIQSLKHTAEQSRGDQKCMEIFHSKGSERRPAKGFQKARADTVMEKAQNFETSPVVDWMNTGERGEKMSAIQRHLRATGRAKQAADLKEAQDKFTKAEEECFNTAKILGRLKAQREGQPSDGMRIG